MKGNYEVAEYRIEFSIQRQTDQDEDFVEVGFGSSGTWGDVDTCAHMVESAVVNADWETEKGMPDPAEVNPQGKG